MLLAAGTGKLTRQLAATGAEVVAVEPIAEMRAQLEAALLGARAIVTTAAVEDLDRLIYTHSLPDDTRQRVARSLQPLGRFPLLGPALAGAWSGVRFVLGPWRWLIVVYEYLEDEDRVVIATIQDGRSSRSATASS